MPIFSPGISAYAASGATSMPTSKMSIPYTAGTVHLNVAFPVAMPNATYTPTFSLGAGVAIPAITVTNQTVNGYTINFVAAVAGNILATVIS